MSPSDTTAPHARRSETRPALMLCALVMLLSACGGLHAQETNATLGLTSGVVTRGIALGHGGAAVQATVTHYSADMWFASLGAATLGAPWNRAQAVQVQGTIGRAWRFSDDWGAQLAYTYYAYPFDPSQRRYERSELGATLAYRDLAFLSVSGLRNPHAEPYGSRRGVAYDLVLRYPLHPHLAATAGAGYQDLRGRSSVGYDYVSTAVAVTAGSADLRGRSSVGYGYGHLGVALGVEPAQLDLSYIATDANAKARFGRSASNRWAASLTWRF